MGAGKLAIAVVESAAAYRRGLENGIAAAGFDVAVPDSPRTWAVEGSNRVCLITLRDQGACELVEAIAEGSGLVVALLPEPTLEAYAHALRHGAVAAVDWNADPDEILATTREAARGRTLLPTEVVTALSKRAGSPHAPLIDPEEIEWLTVLAQGATVVKLADEVGYSERAMFRKLHELYVRLGVKSRVEALVEAERLGLLAEKPNR